VTDQPNPPDEALDVEGAPHDEESNERPDEPESRSAIAGFASSIADAGSSVISAGLRPMGSVARSAGRAISERSGARVRRVRSMAKQPLANLWDVHPEAHRASIRELGLQSVPLDQIKGTAVEGPGQRGGDFLPLRDRRSDDWRSRWQRILRANDELIPLPPIDLIKFGDEYWVVDGHNRVAAGLYTGQGEADAVVEELRLPGMPIQRAQPIAGVLEGSLDLRDAGAGRLTRTTTRPSELLPSHPPTDDEESAE